MFESLGHWFDSLDGKNRLFNDVEDEKLHSALAAVLFHLIDADHKVTNREKESFAAIMKRDLDLNDDQINHLYLAAKSSTSDMHQDLHTINRYMTQNPMLRKDFMGQLLVMADIGGVHEAELKIFYEAMHEIFPELKQ